LNIKKTKWSQNQFTCLKTDLDEKALQNVETLAWLLNLFFKLVNQRIWCAVKLDLDAYHWEAIVHWEETFSAYKKPRYNFKVRDKELQLENAIPNRCRITQKYRKWLCLNTRLWGDLFTMDVCKKTYRVSFLILLAGLLSFKRTGEDPTRDVLPGKRRDQNEPQDVFITWVRLTSKRTLHSLWFLLPYMGKKRPR